MQALLDTCARPFGGLFVAGDALELGGDRSGRRQDVGDPVEDGWHGDRGVGAQTGDAGGDEATVGRHRVPRRPTNPRRLGLVDRRFQVPDVSLKPGSLVEEGPLAILASAPFGPEAVESVEHVPVLLADG